METRSGNMPPIAFEPTLPVSAIDTRALRNARTSNVPTKLSARPPSSPSPGVVTSDALDPGLPPVDTGRVALIRNAVETGTYPILPAKVADAMIAAGLLLRTAK
jgi:negative regulator of flagellin synthesis FlgM